MGKITTPAHRMEMTIRHPDGTHYKQVLSWKGPATDARLQDAVEAHIKSLQTGGVNAHISRAAGYMPIPFRAALVHQRSGRYAATWVAPVFMVL